MAEGERSVLVRLSLKAEAGKYGVERFGAGGERETRVVERVILLIRVGVGVGGVFGVGFGGAVPVSLLSESSRLRTMLGSSGEGGGVHSCWLLVLESRLSRLKRLSSAKGLPQEE